MRLFNFLLILLLLQYRTFAQDCKAFIIVNSDIENVTYYLNDAPAGQGKNAFIETGKGKQVLKAVQSGVTWNPVTFIDTIVINNCGEYNYNYRFMSVMLLKSEPEDAFVFRNDSLIGSTPLKISGNYDNLLLKKKGYRDVRVNGDLKEVIRLQPDGATNGRRFFEKPLFKFLIGGIVVLGGTTAYFKIKADEKFSEYQLSGNEKLLNETRNYDLISGITFGALQINFGLLLYYFLSE